MAWNKVPKPTTTAWTPVAKATIRSWHTVAKPTASIWSVVAKPTESSITTQAFTGGEPIGLLLALTKTTFVSTTSIISGWGDVQKPTIPNWNKVAKPVS